MKTGFVLMILAAGATVAAAAPPPQSPAAADAGSLERDFQTIRTRLIQRALEPHVYDADKLRGIIKNQRSDGSWSGIDYQDQNTVTWATNYHLVLLRHFATAYVDARHPLCGDASLKKAILSGYDYWTRNDFRNKNWWWNAVATPEAFSRIMLMMQQDLSQEQREAGVKLCRRAFEGNGRTGQNLVWIAQIRIALGVLDKDPAMTADGLSQIAREIRVDCGDGRIQPDWSFNQHSDGDKPQLYSGGYGKEFAKQCAQFARLGAGTRFRWPKETVENLIDYVLDGQQWMCRGRMFDYGACGRNIARQGLSAADLAEACDGLAALDTPRKPALVAFARRLRGQSDADEAAPLGNRYFWRTEFMAHQRKGWYSSVKMASRRTVGTEKMNGENLLGAHLFDGVNYLFRSGEEYFDIFPVWDWRRVPGVTWHLADEKDQPVWGYMPKGLTAWAGGVSDGVYGMASLDLWKDATYYRLPGLGKKLLAKKAWFFFDQEYVCLGAGIRCELERPTVVTSVNQCFLKGPVRIADAAGIKTAQQGRQTLSTPAWVLHDGVGYLFPAAGAATLDTGAQTGDWARINSSVGKKEPISRDVFSLWIDHGANPNSGSYAYIVVPVTDEANLAAYAKRPAAEIVANLPTIQAVWNRQAKVGMAALYEAQAVELGGRKLTVDQPCLLLVRTLPGKLELAVSTALATAMDVTVEIGGRLEGEGSSYDAGRKTTRVTFNLSGQRSEAGRPLVKTLADPTGK